MKDYRIKEDKYPNRSEFYPQVKVDGIGLSLLGTDIKWANCQTFAFDTYKQAYDYIAKAIVKDKKEENNIRTETIYHTL